MKTSSLFGLVLGADGVLIASFDFDGGGGGRGVNSGIDDIELSFELPSSDYINISTSGLLGPADIGQSFDLTGSDLADIIALLTNGDDDTLHASVDGGGLTLLSES